MWNDTRVTQRLGIAYPIIQGPFGGGLSSTKLTALVSNAGGMGSFGADYLDPGGIRGLVAELMRLTRKPFAVNLWVPVGQVADPTQDEFDETIALLEPYYRELGLERPARPRRYGEAFEEQVEALLDAQPPVFSFVYGVPDRSILDECRKRGIVTVGTATTAEEGMALDQAGVDAIVASGFEAGGHKGSWLRSPEASTTGTFSLVPQIVDRVRAPVIAAGGVVDARGIRAALALGAEAVQIGTAFLACEESGASPAHRDLLFSSAAKETVLTRVFSGRLARGMKNRFADEMEAYEPELPRYPAQNWFTGIIKQAAIAQGRSDLISLWASQSAPQVRHRNAGLLFEELVRGAATGEFADPVS